LTPQGAKALKKYGVELKDGRVAAKDFAVAMKQLEDGLGDMEGGKKINILSKVFGDEGATAAAILIDKGNKKLVDMRKGLQGVQGKNKEMAATMRDTTSGAIKKLESAISGIIISLFKLEGEGIEGVIKGLTKWIGANKELIVSKIGDFLKDIRDNFDQIISTLKTAGVVIGIIFGIIGALKAFTAIMTVVNLVMMANPIVLIVMAIIAAVALAAFLIYKYWDDIVAGYWWLVRQFEKGIEVAVRIFEGFVDGVVTIFEIVGGAIADFFGGIADALVSAFNFAVDFVKGKIQAVLDFFQPVLDTVREVLGLSEEAPGIAAGGGGAAPRVVSPQDRTVASLEERRMTTTNRTEVTLRDETGRAQVTRGQTGSGFNLQPTGSF
jgi:hypothetical protein